MPTSRAGRGKTQGRKRFIDNPLFDSTFKHSHRGRPLAAGATKPKKPGSAMVMTDSLFKPTIKSSGRADKPAKVKAMRSVQAVVSKIKKVRRIRQAYLERVTKTQDRQRIKITKGGLNAFCYWLGSTLSSSKAILSPQKTG